MESRNCTLAKRLIGSGCRFRWLVESVEGWVFLSPHPVYSEHFWRLLRHLSWSVSRETVDLRVQMASFGSTAVSTAEYFRFRFSEKSGIAHCAAATWGIRWSLKEDAFAKRLILCPTTTYTGWWSALLITLPAGAECETSLKTAEQRWLWWRVPIFPNFFRSTVRHAEILAIKSNLENSVCMATPCRGRGCSSTVLNCRAPPRIVAEVLGDMSP